MFLKLVLVECFKGVLGFLWPIHILFEWENIMEFEVYLLQIRLCDVHTTLALGRSIVMIPKGLHSIPSSLGILNPLPSFGTLGDIL